MQKTSKPIQPLKHYIEGNKNSKNIIVFLQGWPDNHKMWDWIDWKQSLTSQNCLIFIDFPNTTSEDVQLKWGQDFLQIVQRLRQTLRKYDDYQNKMLVAHDWGCIYGYIFDKFISMDVPAYVELTTLTQKLMVVAYQLYLVIAFLIGGPIGKKMTQAFAKMSKHNPPYFNQISSARNYPYFYMFKNRIVSIFNKEKLFLDRYIPSCPIIYLYAKKKPFQFHGQKWMKFLDQTQGCEVHSFDAGHWFMKKYDKFIVQLINRRIMAKL